MEYRITAIKDVKIFGHVRTQSPRRVRDQVVMVPSEIEDWISLRAGEIRDGLGLPLGIHPTYAPDETPVTVGGVSIVLPGGGWGPEDLPKEFFGLYRLEAQGKS